MINRAGRWSRNRFPEACVSVLKSPARELLSVCGGLLDVIDDEDFDGTFGRFELQPELVL